jgi:ABC-type dipeptide/oligopeptide/nickel transport system permease subunit
LNRSVFSTFNLCLLGFLLVCCCFPRMITAYPPNEIALHEKLQSPSITHPFGTDDMGRDLLSRVLYGGRTTILASLLISLGSMFIAICWSGLSAYYGGWIDEIMTRIVDGFMNIPSLLFALLLVSVLQPGMNSLILALILIKWAGDAKMLRGHILGLIRSEYITASISLGSPMLRIIRKDILPNTAYLIFTLFGLNFASNILSIAGLNFLGFGVQLPNAEWGAMINQARPFLQTQPYMMLFPGLAIVVTVISTHFAFHTLSGQQKYGEIQYL